MLGFSIIDAKTQQRVDIEADAFEPLGLEALAGIKAHLAQPIGFQLKLPAGASELPPDTSLTLTMDGPNAAELLGLVNGGWLPPGLWRRDALLMPDQHTISVLREHLHGRASVPESKDFIDRLADEPLRFHPMLFMIESPRGELPKTVAELTQRYRDFQARISEVLPKAEIVPAQNEAVQAAIGLLDQRRGSLEQEKRFLLAAAPLLIVETGKSRRPALWQQLLGLAQKHRIAPASQLFIATLSATAALPELNPARELLRPAKHYIDRDAYRALAKLRALDALNAGIVQREQTQTVLLTQDHALALWWAGVSPHSHSRDGKILNYRLKLNRQLFQRLDAEEWDELTALIFQTKR